MGLTQAMSTASSGLKRSSTGLSTVGHNIANAGTEGYRRQRVLGAAYDPVKLGSAGQLGRGVQVQSITQAVDRFLERQMLRDQTMQGFFGSQTTVLNAVDRLYSAATNPNMGDSLDGFFNAARELSQDPTNGAARASFVSSARGVADGFNVLDRDLRTLQDGIDDTLGEKTDRVSELAAQIAGLNTRISSSEADGSMANDLRDRRDEAIKELSGLVDVNVMPEADGVVNIDIGGQLPLVRDGRAARLETQADPGNQGFLGVQFVSAGGRSRDVTGTLDQGEIGGLLRARDTVIANQRAELDQLAFTFVDQVNAVHRAGFDANGNGNQDLFTPIVGLAGAARSVQVDAAVLADPSLVAVGTDPAGLPGDNRNMMLMADLETTAQALLGGRTFGRRYGEMLEEVGRVGAENSDRADLQSVRATQSEGMVESVTGVSMDDELLDLTRYQKSFEASSKMVQTVDRLLDTVLALIR